MTLLIQLFQSLRLLIVQCKALNTYEDINVQVDNGCFQTLEQTLINSQELGFYFYFLKKYLVLKNLINFVHL
jgi:hypothetical protein